MFHIAYLADYPQFIPKLTQWHHAQWSYLNPQRTMGERVEYLNQQCQRMAIPTGFVAVDGDNVLGSASLVACDLDHRADLSPWLASVFVAPEHRGKRVGDALVARVEEEARAIGIATMYLFTPDRAPFYARRGWEIFDHDQCNGEPITLMRLSL